MSEVVLPTFEEVRSVALASPEHSANSIAAQAERAAKLGNALLGLDEQYLADLFTGQLESMGDHRPTDGLVTIDPNIGWQDENDNVLQPSLVVSRYGEIASQKGKPDLFVWDKMYANRSAAWWNKALPNQEAPAQTDPARIVIVKNELQGLTKDWTVQQTLLSEQAEQHNSESTALEGLKPLSWVSLDADALETGAARPDVDTYNRFVQHERDITDGGVGRGPGARVFVGQADWCGSGGGADDRVGFRVAVGPKVA